MNPRSAETSQAAVTLDDVKRIASNRDPVVRNLQITQAYHDISAAFAKLTGSGANWCSVATWASRQAGQSIRREDLSDAFERLLRDEPEAEARAAAVLAAGAEIGGAQPRSLGGAIETLWSAVNPAAAFERTSAAVARGNLKVFEEIGAEFARFLALFENGEPSGEAVAAFFAALRPGDPPDGQRYLADAFRHYGEAFRSPDDRRRAQLLLLANLEIGFHEQTRLQPEILEAMNAPVANSRDVRRRIVDELFPDPSSRVRYWLARLARRGAPLIAARDQFAEELQQLGRRVVTHALMTLDLPGGRLLRLGDPLPDPFPPTLAEIDLPELRALLASLEPTDIAGEVRDWSDLPQRMRFIAALFRTYHSAPELFDPPFAPSQVADIHAGRRPIGSL
jgi:hypothetical protein